MLYLDDIKEFLIKEGIPFNSYELGFRLKFDFVKIESRSRLLGK